MSHSQRFPKDKGATEEKLTFLSSLYKDLEDAWRWTHISGKLHQLLGYKQPEVTPRHDQLEACKTTFHFSPATQHIPNVKHYNPSPNFVNEIRKKHPLIYKFMVKKRFYHKKQGNFHMATWRSIIAMYFCNGTWYCRMFWIIFFTYPNEALIRTTTWYTIDSIRHNPIALRNIFHKSRKRLLWECYIMRGWTWISWEITVGGRRPRK